MMCFFVKGRSKGTAAQNSDTLRHEETDLLPIIAKPFGQLAVSGEKFIYSSYNLLSINHIVLVFSTQCNIDHPHL